MLDDAEILLVDDDDGFRYACRRMLEAAGFVVTACKGFSDTLGRLQSEAKYDLMISDVVIPKSVNGFVLTQMARTRRPGLKVIHVTAYDDLPAEAAGSKMLRKPIDEADLLREVRAALAS